MSDETKPKTYSESEYLALKAENATLRSAQQPTLFSLKLRDLTSGVIGSISRRLAQARRDDPQFVQELFDTADSVPVVSSFFGRSSSGTLAQELRRVDKDKYLAARRLATTIGLLAPEPLDDEPSPSRNLPLCRG